MAKEIKVAKAFQSTVSKEDSTPTVIQTKGGEMHKFLAQFEGRTDWISILKKPGNEVKTGDVLYGNIIEDGQWGKPEFKGEQRPFGESSATPLAHTPVTTPNNDSVNEKLDFIISMLENLPQFKSPGSKQAPNDTVLEDIDDGPVDLSKLPY